MAEFHDLGPVPLESSAYVPRDFESQAFQELNRGRWVLLLGPRQHGKTTGILRILDTLGKAGVVTARVDLQGLPAPGSYADLLRAVAQQVHRTSTPSVGGPLEPPADVEALVDWFEAALPESTSPIVISIDEAASIVSDELRNSFFGQIREIATQSADAPAGSFTKRLRFVFARTFRPESLVHPNNSPFNVCEHIITGDLSIEAATTLAKAVNPSLEPIVSRAFSYVGGQPHLLQVVFRRSSEMDGAPIESSCEQVLAQLDEIEYGHLSGMLMPIRDAPTLLSLIREMVRDGYVPLVPASQDHRYLQVLGVARREGNVLVFRSEFYKSVVSANPQFSSPDQPAANLQRRPLLFPLSEIDLGFVQDTTARAVIRSLHDGAVTCHNAGHFRLSLAGFGAATEALLLAWLQTVNATNLGPKVAVAETTPEPHRTNLQRGEDRANPGTWRFVNMINVARQFDVGRNKMEASHALREWRNLIHAAASIAHYVEESVMSAESTAAAGQFMILIRDVASVYGTV